VSLPAAPSVPAGHIRVLVCDDHLIVRQGIRQVLADAEDICVMAEAASGAEAIALTRAGLAQGQGPDVLLLDIALPQRDGLDVLKALKAEWPRLPVLMLSTYPDRQYAVRSLKLGAAGYLNKSADSAQMIEAVRRAARGQRFITESVAELLAGALGSIGSVGSAAAGEAPLHERLSHREYQVFQLLAAGHSVGEIAEQLVLSPNTVSTYRARLLEKCAVRNDVELALYAVRVGAAAL
jgi:two-component system invasion response regulator UvrY